MRYWIYLKKKNKLFRFQDYCLDGIVPDHVLNMLVAQFVDSHLDLCRDCNLDSSCHVIDGDTGRMYCPVLFKDVFKTSWRLKDLL